MGQCSLHVERLLTFLPLVKRAPVRLEEPLTIVNNRCMYADVAGEATWVRKRMREGRGEQVWLRTLTLVPLPLTVLFCCCWRWPAGMQSGSSVKRRRQEQTAAEQSRAQVNKCTFPCISLPVLLACLLLLPQSKGPLSL